MNVCHEYHEYLLTAVAEDAINQVIAEFMEMVNRIKASITEPYNSIVNDDFFKTTAKCLHTPSYQDVDVIVERYTEKFKANDYGLQKLKQNFASLIAMSQNFWANLLRHAAGHKSLH